MVESNLNEKEIIQKPQKSPKPKRRRNSSGLYTFALPTVLLFLAGIFLFTYEYRDTTPISATNEPTIRAVETPKETIIIEFESQIIPVKCHGFEYRNYERVSWNESIKITPRGEFEYVSTSNRLIILPYFSAYHDDNEIRYDLDGVACFAYEPLTFNLTISG